MSGSRRQQTGSILCQGAEATLRRGEVQSMRRAEFTSRSTQSVEFLERRVLLSIVLAGTDTLPDESLGVEGFGQFEIRRPARFIAELPGENMLSGAAGFQIEIVFGGGLTPSQQAIFNTAAARWQQILTGDIPDVGSGPWGTAVDDVRISASGVYIDGVGGILGQAGPTYLRSGTYLPISGNMQFDTADLASLESSGQLEEVVMHEMAHVLGLGTIWDLKDQVSGAGTANPVYLGARATSESNAARGVLDASVPLENVGGPGTADSHWRESIFDNELMTGYLDEGANPISRITCGQGSIWAIHLSTSMPPIHTFRPQAILRRRSAG